ncbi:hypothetical protein [Paraflavitalea pollutisoli]|uniref:hypothetical protein n=1 Tax=Paraflavitalea pollutisoli TaxID=3034143 RepID=UPI0023EC7156|nr:hypothetical protein [Paraflavitalea sp. H1-2-19X]
MRRLLFLAVICIAFTACDKDQAEGTQEESLSLGQCKSQQVSGDRISLCYETLIEDSRCPKEVNCVWEGIAIGQFTFTVNNNRHTLTLSTTSAGRFINDTTIGRYKIHLQELLPYPSRSPREAVTPSASVSITRQ